MNKNIHLIYSNDSLVEMEYIKRFLEFIGFQVTIFPFDYSTLDSLYNIMNYSEKNCGKAIEIVLNYFELNDFSSNKFLYEIGKCNCEYYGIERFYLYFNFDCKFFYMNKTPLCKNENIDKDNNITKSELRYNVLNNLIEKLFKNNEIEKESVKEILDCYFKCDNRDFKSNDDMFYLLSAKNNLDVINWSELNNESSLDKIYLNQYIKHIIDRLLELYKITSNKTDYFSLYTNINSALNIYDILILLTQYDINLLVKEDNSIYQIINDCNNNKYILSKYDQLIENVSSKYDLINLLFLFKRMNEWCMDDEIELNIHNEMLKLINNDTRIIENSKIYMSLANHEMQHKEFNLIEDFENSKCFHYLNLAKILNPLSVQAYYCLGKNFALCGKLKRAEAELSKLINVMTYSYNIENVRNKRNSFSYDIFKNLCTTYNLLAKISLGSNLEYSALNNINFQAYLSVDFKDALLEHVISDFDEISYQKFLDYQKDSLPVYKLYKELEPWTDIFKNNCDLKAILSDTEVLEKYKTYK